MKQGTVYNKNMHFDKSRWWLVAAIFTYAVFFSSCSKDELVDDSVLPPVPEGYVRMPVNLMVSENEQVQTRASDTEEKAFDDANVWVLVFDTSDEPKLMQNPVKATKNGSQLYAMLRATGEACRLYLVTGLNATMNSYLNTSANFVEGETSYSTISGNLFTTAINAAGIPVGGGNYIPMCSPMIECPGGTVGMREISKSILRIAAKIEIDAKAVTNDFTIAGATLWNGSKRGHVLPQSPMLAYDGDDVLRYSEKTGVSENCIRSQIYLYENNGTLANNAANPTIVIVKGTYKGITGYYRLDIFNTATGQKPYAAHSITRNFLYILKITKIETVGYATADEAAANTASNNISYDVEVSDGTSFDIASNGEYYLGLSNSECLVYALATQPITVAISTVSHNAPSTVLQGNVSFKNVVGDAPTISSNPFTAEGSYDGTIKTADLNLTFSGGFSSCDVVLTLGNLTKTIKLERTSETLSFGGAFSLGNGYVSGTIGSPQAWVKLSTTETGGADKIFPTVDQSVYAILEHNLATNSGVPDRKAELFLSRLDEKGRKKVVLNQLKYDIINDGGAGVIKNTYVGTFHRHNQVGERVISIKTPKEGVYMVQVVQGQHFIRVAPGIGANGSADPNLLTANHSDAENYPVQDGKTQLVGNSNHILFRVGMAGTIGEHEVRYGLILVTHSGGVNRIFVRQGEEPDFVMRPDDPIGGNADIVKDKRPNAVKLTAFNLTDPQGRTGRVDLGSRKGGFTQFPSEGGYFFQAFQPYAWYPTGNVVNWNSSISVDPNWESCPPGYRRIKDGIESGNEGLAEGSEMRQSLWYYPKNGSSKSDYENSIRGLLADGSFDRKKQIEIKYSKYSGISVGEGSTIGYLGVIIFNPYNYASIFMPGAGSRNYFSNGGLYEAGASSLWWSSSKKSDNAAWFGSMEYYGGGFTFDNYATYVTNAASVRCVVE